MFIGATKLIFGGDSFSNVYFSYHAQRPHLAIRHEEVILHHSMGSRVSPLMSKCLLTEVETSGAPLVAVVDDRRVPRMTVGSTMKLLKRGGWGWSIPCALHLHPPPCDTSMENGEREMRETDSKIGGLGGNKK